MKKSLALFLVLGIFLSGCKSSGSSDAGSSSNSAEHTDVEKITISAKDAKGSYQGDATATFVSWSFLPKGMYKDEKTKNEFTDLTSGICLTFDYINNEKTGSPFFNWFAIKVYQGGIELEPVYSGHGKVYYTVGAETETFKNYKKAIMGGATITVSTHYWLLNDSDPITVNLRHNGAVLGAEDGPVTTFQIK